jgi:hypothetical protein
MNTKSIVPQIELNHYSFDVLNHTLNRDYWTDGQIGMFEAALTEDKIYG